MDTNRFQKKLEEEHARLEEELKKMARPDPGAPGEWDPKKPDFNPMVSDPNEMSDVFEELDNTMGIEYQLEERLKEVKAALVRIEKGEYGKCETDGTMIDERRLEANPAARTCMEHASS